MEYLFRQLPCPSYVFSPAFVRIGGGLVAAIMWSCSLVWMLALLVRLKRRLLKVTPVNRLMVYGSRARGDAASDSDLDLYIEGPADYARYAPEIQRRLPGKSAWRTGYRNINLDLQQPVAGQPIIKAD